MASLLRDIRQEVAYSDKNAARATDDEIYCEQDHHCSSSSSSCNDSLLIITATMNRDNNTSAAVREEPAAALRSMGASKSSPPPYVEEIVVLVDSHPDALFTTASGAPNTPSGLLSDDSDMSSQPMLSASPCLGSGMMQDQHTTDVVVSDLGLVKTNGNSSGSKRGRRAPSCNNNNNRNNCLSPYRRNNRHNSMLRPVLVMSSLCWVILAGGHVAATTTPAATVAPCDDNTVTTALVSNSTTTTTSTTTTIGGMKLIEDDDTPPCPDLNKGQCQQHTAYCNWDSSAWSCVTTTRTDDVTHLPVTSTSPPTEEVSRAPPPSTISPQPTYPRTTPPPPPTPSPTAGGGGGGGGGTKVITDSPTFDPTPKPTTKSPTLPPTPKPTTKSPTEEPTMKPIVTTKRPSQMPTYSPTIQTEKPTRYPTRYPTRSPTPNPTNLPTPNPTPKPSQFPSMSPTWPPSASPSASPTASPSDFPSKNPTDFPTISPKPTPLVWPSASPTVSSSPTASPSHKPSYSPTASPSRSPTVTPTTPAPLAAGETRSPTSSPTPAPTLPSSSRVLIEDVPTAITLENAYKMKIDSAAYLAWEEITKERIAQHSQELIAKTSGEKDVDVAVTITYVIQRGQDEQKRRGLGDGSGRRVLQEEIPLRLTFSTSLEFDSKQSEWDGSALIASGFIKPSQQNDYISDLNKADPESFGSVKRMTMSVNSKVITESTEENKNITQSNTLTYIIAGVVAGVLVLFVIGGGVYYVKRRNNRRMDGFVNKKGKKLSDKYPEKRASSDFYNGSGNSGTMMSSPPSKSFPPSPPPAAPQTSSPVGDYFGTIEPRPGHEDDVSTLGDPYIGDVHVNMGGDNTVTESLMSSGNDMYVYGVSRPRMNTGDSSRMGSASTINGNLRMTFQDDGTIEEFYGTPDQTNFHSEKDSNFEHITVVAKSGVLGIVIDNPTRTTPIVHAIKETSILHGRVHVGDFLMSVDEVDCRGMTAVAVSKLIGSRSNNPTRTLKLLRGATLADVRGDCSAVAY